MLLLFILLPLAVAAVMPLLDRISRRLPDALAIMVIAALFVMECGYVTMVSGGEAFYWSATKYGVAAGFSLMLDGLSLLFLITISLIGFFSAIFSSAYMESYGKKSTYYALFLLMIAGMNGLVLTRDLFNLYVFLEVAAVAGYALVAYGQQGDNVEGAFKYLMLSVVATTSILLSLSFIYFMTGTLNLSLLAAQAGTEMNAKLIAVCVALFLMGFGLKVGVVPFHGWLPDAYSSAPAPISAMLSGILGKVTGIYALLRVVFSVFGLTPTIAHIFTALGVTSMLVGALLAIGQTDFRRMLAYSSISQIGYIFLGFGTGTAMGIAAGLFHLFNHSVFKSLLFLDAGSMEYATGVRDLRKLGGINNRLPITGVTTTIGFLSTAGVPPFNGFWSKLFVILALVGAQQYFMAVLAVGASILTLWYFLQMQRWAFYGKLAAGLEFIREVPFGMAFATACLALLCLAIGLCYPWITTNLIQPGVTALMGAKMPLM
jgi:multicomponent Na+:H+ antiporter subunit D